VDDERAVGTVRAVGIQVRIGVDDKQRVVAIGGENGELPE
jgi:hypothetical protein